MMAILTHDDESDNYDKAYVKSTAAATTTATAATTTIVTAATTTTEPYEIL